MELDDFKNTWNNMDEQVKAKQNLTLKLFDKMSQNKLRSSLRKIILPELLGSVVCIGSAAYIGFNFEKLDKLSLQIAGVVGILLLLILPVISLMSIRHFFKSGNIDQPYADTLKEFALQKIGFCKLQKINLLLSYLLLVTIILLSTRIFGRNEITDSRYFFVFAFTFGYCFLLFFSKAVFKSYNKTIRKSEDLLKEL